MTERELLAETLRDNDLRDRLLDTYLDDADCLIEHGYRREIETVYDVIKVVEEVLVKHVPMPKLETVVKDLQGVATKKWNIDWESSEDED